MRLSELSYNEDQDRYPAHQCCIAIIGHIEDNVPEKTAIHDWAWIASDINTGHIARAKETYNKMSFNGQGYAQNNDIQSRTRDRDALYRVLGIQK
ncbi:MAG: hypothetical protein KUG49_00770 [Dokdonia sp.]|nr:hypothetical protein [Dokdonia sp.]